MDYNDEASKVPDDVAIHRIIGQLRTKVLALPTEPSVTPRTDDEFLSKFLNSKNFVVDEALKSVKKYYANVKRNLEFIEGIRPSDFEETFHTGPFIVFKNRSKGRRVGAVQVGLWKPKETPLRDVQLTALFIAEQVLKEQETQQKGLVVIFDMRGLTFEHVRYSTPRELKRILLTGQEGLPVKISEVHIVNPPPFFWPLHAIAMRFVKEKIRKRIHLHYSSESLHQFLGPGICPASLGGLLSEYEAKDNDLVKEIVGNNIFYEDMWSGDKNRKKPKKKLCRKRSSPGDVVVGSA